MDSDAKFTMVQEVENGLIVLNRKVRTDDLIESLISMMEEMQFIRVLMKKGKTLREILEPIFEYGNELEMTELFRQMLNNVPVYSKEQKGLLIQLFGAFAEVIHLKELDSEKVTYFLDKLLNYAEETDKEVINRMMAVMLKKLDLSVAPNATLKKIIQQLQDRVQKEQQQETIHEMFLTIADRADPQWMRQVISKIQPQLVLRRSPMLPKNTVLFHEYMDGSYLLVLEIEKGRHNVTYLDTLIENAGHPKMLFAFRVSGDKVTDIRVLCVKDPVISYESEIFKYPFGNVFGDFRPCWQEGYKLPFKSLAHLATRPYRFIGAPMNGHAYSGKNLRERLMDLRDKDFNDNELMATGRTLADVLGLTK